MKLFYFLSAPHNFQIIEGNVGMLDSNPLLLGSNRKISAIEASFRCETGQLQIFIEGKNDNYYKHTRI